MVTWGPDVLSKISESVRRWVVRTLDAGSTAFGLAESSKAMAFIQAIEFATERRNEVLELMARWSADAIGRGTAQRATMLEDRSAPGHFVTSVRFESAESAAENSNRTETSAFAEQFSELCSEGPTFREFDVVETYGS